MKKEMEAALNAQINAEFYSSYLYLAMQSYFQSLSLSGFASWMRCQAQEELFHGIKFYNYVNERGGKVILEGIAKPDSIWTSPLQAFEQVLAHERKVTGLINDLVEVALNTKDHATNIFLQWFVTEQVEEEASAVGIVDKLRLIGNDSSGLFFLDAELAKRVFTPPQPV
ncbi:MAG: ferritin [Desulfobulbaceae bacterium]|nr:ferritin [Desulfobulbaceae bacterium]